MTNLNTVSSAALTFALNISHTSAYITTLTANLKYNPWTTRSSFQSSPWFHIWKKAAIRTTHNLPHLGNWFFHCAPSFYPDYSSLYGQILNHHLFRLLQYTKRKDRNILKSKQKADIGNQTAQIQYIFLQSKLQFTQRQLLSLFFALWTR